MRNRITCLFILSFTCSLVPTLTAESPPADMFAKRRQILMEKMDGGVAVLRSNEVVTRNGDVHYNYRQGSDFYYLSGFEEPGSALLFIPGAKHQFIMFVRPRNVVTEIWDGKRYGTKGAMKFFGADTAYNIKQFEAVFKNSVRGKEKLYASINDANPADPLLSLLRNLKDEKPKEIINPRPIIAEMRLFKSAEEIAIMRRSIEITGEAHIEAFKAATPGMSEYELEAIISYIYRKNGSARAGFPSIIGAGENSTVLHYNTNNDQIQNGDVIVMDIGAEYKYYSADITRTIPANGIFSKEQRKIYSIVLKAQQAGIDMIKPGIAIGTIQNRIKAVVKEGLFDLGLITDTSSRWQYRVWFMHGSMHWLGLDVHDAGSYREPDGSSRILKPNMVTTVEPGIYINANALQNLKNNKRIRASADELDDFIQKVRPVAAQYTNIGVRIEDDILVTSNGHELLSGKAPRTIEAIEALMKKESYVNK